MRRQTLMWLLLLIIVIVAIWYYAKPGMPTGDIAEISDVPVDDEIGIDTEAIEQEAIVNIPERPVADTVDVNGQVVTAVTDAQTYRLMEGSTIEWIGRKVGGQHVGVVNITQGDLLVKNGQVAGGTFSIDMTSLRSTDGTDRMLDDDLKSDNFFAVEDFPTATFEVLSVDSSQVRGILTMKGVSKIITFPATVIVENDIIVVNAEFALDRTQRGIDGNRGIVSNYIEIMLRLTWTS